MGKRLTVKFLLGYLCFGIFCLLLITFVTSWMIGKGAERRLADHLYEEAYHLAGFCSDFDPGLNESAFLRREAEHAATFTDADVWIVRPDGEVVTDTSGRYEGGMIEGFDPAARGAGGATGSRGNYRIGRFYGAYSEDVITVAAPITEARAVTGYVVMTTPVDEANAVSAQTMRAVGLTGLIIFLASFVFLLMLRVMVVRPLAKITRAAEEYAKGNLGYRIEDISKYDEMGSLASTLNYMSDELRDAEASQRKFVSNISHDFRSPLTSIKGYLEAMLDGTIPPEKHERYLNVVLDETDRLMNMAETTLNLQRIEAKGAMLDLTEFDVNETIRRTAASFGGVCVPRGIVLDMTFDDEQLFVIADEPKIEQVLHNLIDNAIKFTADETDIWVETYRKGGTAFISVKDAGCGISPEDQKKIWGRFYKGDSSRGAAKESTGLGLAICREIIHNHGQTIDVISTEGVGTEFIFTLKAAEQDYEDL